jgi:hypothetical protein
MIGATVVAVPAAGQTQEADPDPTLREELPQLGKQFTPKQRPVKQGRAAPKGPIRG